MPPGKIDASGSFESCQLFKFRETLRVVHRHSASRPNALVRSFPS
jgi:hypothetical protein